MLGLSFAVVVALVTFYQHTYLLPLFVGMTTKIKGLLKLLTPKFAVLLFKNSLFLKFKQFLIRSSTRFVVLSHKPWRHRMRWMKTNTSKTILTIIQLYMGLSLWLRTAIAIAVLIATASSSYVLIALLIIPQPILTWLKGLILSTLNKLGITHFFNTIWKLLMPTGVQHKWHMHRKWTLGRRQVITAMRVREAITTTQPDNTPAPQPKNNTSSDQIKQ